MVFHPWRRLRELTDVRLEWEDTDAILGCFDYCTRKLTMATDLTQAERRSTLAHELMHVERGPCAPGQEQREEEIVDKEASRLLINIHELGEALAWTTDMAEAADELWVDEIMLRARLKNLHPAERAYLHRRLAEV